MSRWPALAGVAILLMLGACSREQPVVAASSEPASRIVTLAPHLAEIVFAAGAGESLVGVSAYTDYPPAAAELPVISDAFTVDQERLRLLQPDLVLAWASGMPASTIDELRATGLNVVTVETQGLDDIASAMRRVGELTGRSEAAAEAAAAFEASLDDLRAEYGTQHSVAVFYQVSSRPLYTVNGDHFISELIELCGGVNVFAGLSELAPAIDVEAVLAADPDAIIGLGPAESLAIWDRFEAMRANRYGNRIVVESTHLARASPRLDTAGRALCESIDTARSRLPDAG